MHACFLDKDVTLRCLFPIFNECKLLQGLAEETSSAVPFHAWCLQVDLVSDADAKRIQAFIKALNPTSQILLTRNSKVRGLLASPNR